MPSTSRPRDSNDGDVPPVYEEDVVQLANQIQKAASFSRKAVPKSDVVAAIDGLSQHASVRGLSPEALDVLIETLTRAPCSLDQAALSRIIKTLIPRRKVSEDIVVKVVGCLGSGPHKPALAIQAGLLRWLVMVYNVLEDYTVLLSLYGILFNQLYSMTLRGHICHLLSLVTRRKHIKPFRIQALLQLKRDLGNEQPVNALLQVYKNYYPDIILGDVGPFKAGLFTHPDPEWMQRVLTIQEINAATNPDQQTTSFRVVRQVGDGGQSRKRRKTDRVRIPQVHTFRAVQSSVTLEEVRNVDDFVKKLDKLELPSQLAAVLDDTLLQNLLALRPSATSDDRINNWLAAYLEDDLRMSKLQTTGAAARTNLLLSKILNYTRSTRRLLPSVEEYLRKYLQQWDSKSHVKAVLELVSFLPLREFEQLQTSFLQPIEKARKSGSDMSAPMLLGFYTALLRNWAVIYSTRSPENKPGEKEAQTPRRFIKHVGNVSLKLFRETGDTTALGSAVLTFYECASTLPWENTLFRIVLPPDPLVYHFLFVGNVVMFSRLCAILVNFKAALERQIGSYDTPYVDHFNGFIMDICNCLWRNRAFTPADGKDNKSALACTIPETVIPVLRAAAAERGVELKFVFSFSHSPALALFSAECFRAMEKKAGVEVRHHGPVTIRSLQQLEIEGGIKMSHSAYRIAALNDLKERGFEGISEFMHSTMMSLKKEGRIPVSSRTGRRRV